MEPEKAVKEARKVMEKRFAGLDYEPGLEGEAGVFVTLTKGGELRGCIGLPEPVPLSEGVRQAALGAMRDPRFPPLRREELGEVEVEVSLLTKPKPAGELPGSVEVGRHGLVVKRGPRAGLLLPQVAPEWGWSAEEFLDHCCLKAGLPAGSWRDGDTQVLTFEATVYGEEGPGGPVVRKLDKSGD